MAKKILILVTKGEVGGAQQSVFNLAKGARENGAEVTVGMGENASFLEKKLAELGIHIKKFNWLKRTLNPLANLFFIAELKKYLDKQFFNAVHFNSSNTLIGAIAAKLSKSAPKTIFTFRGMSVLDEHYELSWPARLFYCWYFKFLMSFIDHPVFVSRTNLARGRKLKLADKGTVIYNAINENDLNFAERNSARTMLSAKIGRDLNNHILIGSIGRLAYPKNYEFFIENFAEIIKTIPNAIGFIIGKGPEKAKYEKLIAQHQLSGKFFLLGEITNAGQWLKGFDIFVLPSKFEGFSITLLEALAAGTPIVASNVGGSGEMLENGGLVYPLNDAGQFIKIIIKLANDEKLRQQLGELAKEKSRKFSYQAMIGRYLKLYSE